MQKPGRSDRSRGVYPQRVRERHRCREGQGGSRQAAETRTCLCVRKDRQPAENKSGIEKAKEDGRPLCEYRPMEQDAAEQGHFLRTGDEEQQERREDDEMEREIQKEDLKGEKGDMGEHRQGRGK